MLLNIFNIYNNNMSKELLDKLKIKPKAEIRPNIDVIIKQPEEKKRYNLKN